jgi:hypothetical protein
MNREECEKLITEKLLEIRKIYKEYNPNGDYLTAHITNNHVDFNNEYWEGGNDEEKPIDVIITTEVENEV